MNSPLGLPEPYRATGSSSFVEFLSALHPERLRFADPATTALHGLAPHGTTIVALRTAGGVSGGSVVRSTSPMTT